MLVQALLGLQCLSRISREGSQELKYGLKGFKSDNFSWHVEERKHVRAVQLSQKKVWNVATTGPIDKYTNQLTKEISKQLLAKFAACNLVCTEGLAAIKCTPILKSYELNRSVVSSFKNTNKLCSLVHHP